MKGHVGVYILLLWLWSRAFLGEYQD